MDSDHALPLFIMPPWRTKMPGTHEIKPGERVMKQLEALI